MSETAHVLGYPPSRQVGFLESVPLFFKNYVNFKGRSSRGAYWWWGLASGLISIVLSGIDGAIFGFGPEDAEVFGTIFGLIVFLPNIALSVRRLHDVGRSGWWLLLYLTVIGILVIIWWAAQPGERETNRFGPDSEAGKASADDVAATFA
ncbi:MAG: DUF805 domain-containing protein, partial [Shimia sp.]